MKNRPNGVHYLIMISPGLLFVIVYNIIPVFGIVIAFQDFIPAKGLLNSKWVGLENFEYLLQLPDCRQVFYNTMFIAVLKIFFNLLIPLIFALALNEIDKKFIKKTIQTIVYLPHFLSWVILAGIFTDLLSSNGIINQTLIKTNVISMPIFFLGSNVWFPIVLVFTEVWKEFGFNAIIYLAALTSIDGQLYEAAEIDGASRIRCLIHITIPGISSTIILLATLGIGNFLNAGFEQVLNLYNPLVYESGDIIDTYVYRMGLINNQYSMATAVGTLKAVVGFALIFTSYKLADKYANYRIF